ncbi:membrane protein [Cellulomonas chitinilytica]|uniref:Membrane protein n=1 Tax=Cellulomonas chitinilytica TaxID=398759 RepID=A0A919P0J1_9CELL|nr:MMPL family transporter [Cellulomonas chitinilytica]GIG19294.1 membrane protein [Cellulomonas chitinilytica]
MSLWVVLVAVSLTAGQLAGLRTLSEVDSGVGQSGDAARWVHEAGLDDPAVENVLITAPEGGALPSDAADAAADAAGRLTGLPQVRSVGDPVSSPDGTAMIVAATLTERAASAEDLQPLLDATAATQTAHPGLRVEQVGGTSLDVAMNALVDEDLSAAAAFSLPVTLVILLVAFGALLAGGVPVLLALSAVAAATGLSAVASRVVPDSGSTSAMILLIGMAVGVDYSLFYVKRAREERAAGRSHLDAVEIAAETSGHSVIVSGVAVIVSMLGLLVAQDAVFTSLAAGAVLVVAVAVIGSLTVLPAVLVLLGARIDRPRVPLVWRLSARSGGEPRVWARVLRPALSRPGATLVVTSLVLVALAVPALDMKLGSSTLAALPRSVPEVLAYERLAAAFPGEQTTHTVVVKAPAADADAVTRSLDQLGTRLADEPSLVSAGTTVRASDDGTVHVLTVAVPVAEGSAQAEAGVEALRDDLVPATLGTVTGARWAVGGDAAESLDADRHLSAHMPWVVAFVVLATMLLMLAMFRSVWLAVVTAVANLLSAGAAFGVLVLVFQHSWAEGLLDFRSTGAIVPWIPLFTFAVLFGLSMDYHVFVVSRVREAVAAGQPARDAVRTGILRSAGTVTSAAVVMVSVFAIFAALHLVEMKEIGVGLAVAVLVDVLVVRALFLPAALALLGDRAWWPSRPAAVAA